MESAWIGQNSCLTTPVKIDKLIYRVFQQSDCSYSSVKSQPAMRVKRSALFLCPQVLRAVTWPGAPPSQDARPNSQIGKVLPTIVASSLEPC